MNLERLLVDAETPLDAIRIVRDWLEERGHVEAGKALHDETWNSHGWNSPEFKVAQGAKPLRGQRRHPYYRPRKEAPNAPR